MKEMNDDSQMSAYERFYQNRSKSPYEQFKDKLENVQGENKNDNPRPIMTRTRIEPLQNVQVYNPEFLNDAKRIEEFIINMPKPQNSNRDEVRESFKALLQNKLKSKCAGTKELVSVDYIQSIKERADKKLEQQEKRKKLELRKVKWQERKEYWQNFNFKEYLLERRNKAFENVSNFVKKVFNKIEDWRFMLSLNKSQRALFRGWKKSQTSHDLIRLALKKNLDLNEIKKMSSRVDAVPE